MGPRDLVSPADAATQQFSLALRGYPSPAECELSLDSPTLSKTLTGASPSIWTPRAGFLDSATAMPTEPGAAEEMPILSPPAERNSDLLDPMSRVVGGVLAPVYEPRSRSSSRRPGPGLQLPSFQKLGIASPYPARFGYSRAGSAPPLARGNAGPVARTHSISDGFEGQQPLTAAAILRHNIGGVRSPGLGRAIQSPIPQHVQMLTPPAETGEPAFLSDMACVMTKTALDSPDTEPGTLAEHTQVGVQSSEPSSMLPGAVEAGASTTRVVPVTAPIITGERAWVDGAVQAVSKCMNINIHRWSTTSDNS
jgi:hypothetical protein